VDPGGTSIVSIDVDGSAPPTVLPIGEQMVTFFTWQRLAP
jgi:hypothetical protein